MSEGQDGRAERVARYKEERRKQLAAQFSSAHSSDPSSFRRTNKDTNSSSSEGPRPTRASKLRAAAATVQENGSSPTQATRFNIAEKTPPSGHETTPVNGSRRTERDKSSKRKSNLNRALNSEEVPNLDDGVDDVKSRRRRRRFFPPEVLDAARDNNSSNDENRTKSDTNLTASSLQSSTSPITASSPVTSRLTPRKSELRIHMENARKGVAPSYSEMGKYRPPTKRAVTSSPKSRVCHNSDLETSHSDKDIVKVANKENVKRKSSLIIENKIVTNKCSSDNDITKTNRTKAKTKEELSALTRETLADVERLASKNKEPPKQIKRPLSTSPIKHHLLDSRSNRFHQPSSILKKKSIEEPIIEHVPNATTAPVSILKRKVSQDDHRFEGNTTTHTPPVTFSPSVVEPATTNRKQGILKKRRSLDESQVMRHRSCSPDVANKVTDSRSILKNQRRSSLEELTRTQSPELQLHGILKRKTSRAEEDDSLNSPQGILKRRSGASSAGSTGSTPHVSITTAVILAAAGGAEMVLEPEMVKPILKKKSFSEEHSYSESSAETPKPILKKKSSTETDECDERPKKPILKISRGSVDRDSDSNMDSRLFSNFKHNIPNDNDCDVKPILKQNGSKEDGAKPRLSFSSDRNGVEDDVVIRHRSTRRSHTICADFNINNNLESKEEDRELKKPRPLSVSELVMTFESSTSTGAIPKRSSLKRTSDRYRTQPVTSNELEASLNFVVDDKSRQVRKSSPLRSLDHSINSLLDFTSSLEDDSRLNSFLSSLHNISPDSGVCGKMSSDSAFQSLGDGLELDQDDDKSPVAPPRPAVKLEPKKLELQMKAIAEEAKKMKLGKGNLGLQKYHNRKVGVSDRAASSRFSTQPVTFDEVQEAVRINKTSDDSEEKDEADPSKLSLSERIKLFNVKVPENVSQKRDVPRRRLNRFQTQPVTSDEVETARCIPPTTYALDESAERSERRGILKSSSVAIRGRGDSSGLPPRSVLKKRGSFESGSDRRSILKSDVADVTYDEGISCNDSASDSEIASAPVKSVDVDSRRHVDTRRVLSKFGKSGSDTTSDGDSSGGREIRSIFKNENKLKVKQALESVLSKSRSQSAFGDESESSRKGTAIRRSQTQAAMPRTIAEIQARLQQSGESDWRRRIPQNNNSNDELKCLKDKNRYNDELSEKSILAAKKDELDAASHQWKSRVEKSDAEKYSVAGRMEKTKDAANLSINIDKSKRTPQAKRYKGKEGSDSSSTPVSPDKSRRIELSRSYSVPDPDKNPSSQNAVAASGRKVVIDRPDDFTFKNFYKSIEENKATEQLDLTLDDFDVVTRHSLLVQKKNIQVQRRRGQASRNPIKALASRTDITNEYTEVITGVAEREKKRLNIEKLARHSNLAVEALAGLASKEDFTSVALKKSTFPTSLVPFKDVMLLQVKGRRHVQTRLVEPTASSINEGDNFILVTGSAVYNYIGAYSNVIEQSRAVDIVNHIQQTGDLGCKNVDVITIDSKSQSSTEAQRRKFWKTLKCEEGETFTNGGHPDEDEIYESNILATNMIYGLDGDELVPLEEYWGKIPKIEMLEPTKVIVFDFGSEMYVWSGKNAPLDKKKLTLKLAKELWEEGYNYSECNVCPLNVASLLGDRSPETVSRRSDKRPDWALFAKITQHRETILFREKFLDWPDFSRIIRVKGDENDKFVDPTYKIDACNVSEMLKRVESEPDLIVEGHHLGRGREYFDAETKRLFEFDTLDITVWHILENQSEKLCDSSVGHFYDSDSYIVRWNYRMTVKGRELSGKPSKYAQAGRDRCVYFCWQGSNASINEKGYAALLTIELDSEKAPQIRVVQGAEPAAFLGLFNGNMVVHSGKRDEPDNQDQPRLFMVRGELEAETSLIEVPCKIGQLRSRTSFILVDGESEEVTIWHGVKSSQQKRRVTKKIVDNIIVKKADEFALTDCESIDVVEVEEGDENEEFFEAVGKDRTEYFSLLNNKLDYDFTMRLFYLSSVSGKFKATEILCPYRNEYSSPFPFLQNELYSASQPALFLIDNHHELWLWQGWWPEREEEEVELSDQTGSGAVRWQAERKAAMQTAVDYWRKKHSGEESVPAYLVWAGLEPLEFKNLFPVWVSRDDVAELNLKDGRREGAKLSLEKELALLLRTTYPLAELLQRPLPEGVDPTHLEIYLSPEDFQELLSMTKEEFQKLPPWKQTAMKKEKGLF